MFDSGITASSFVAGLKTEVDIALSIANSTYVMWLNSLEQLLYSEFIKEQKAVSIATPPADTIPITNAALDPDTGESRIRFEDIHTVFADGVQLEKSTLNSGSVFPDTYFKNGNDIGYNREDVEEITIVYFVRPALITLTEETIGAGNVMLPYEFLDLVKAKLRGEAYKLVNEDDTAAKWLNDYNVLLENFKAWLGLRQPNFGM
jgi:hypothetical protein